MIIVSDLTAIEFRTKSKPKINQLSMADSRRRFDRWS